MTGNPDRPIDPVPSVPPEPGKAEPIPPEMPTQPGPEIMPTPTSHPGGPPGSVA